MNKNSSFSPHKLSNEYVHSFSTYTIHNSPHWMINDPFMTHFMNALSITFPDGERFFMKAVKSYASSNNNNDGLIIKADIKNFLAQEALHGKAHANFNEFIKRQDYPVDVLVKLVQDLLKTIEVTSAKSKYTKRLPLSITCALEHVTAIMGELILSNKQLMDNMDPHLKPLWQWHAIEELEHKSVAFDVYQNTTDSSSTRSKVAFEIERITTFLIATVGFLFAIHAFQIILMASDGTLDLHGYVKGLDKLYMKEDGYIRLLIPEWKKYLKIGFNPRDIKNVSIIGLQKPKV